MKIEDKREVKEKIMIDKISFGECFERDNDGLYILTTIHAPHSVHSRLCINIDSGVGEYFELTEYVTPIKTKVVIEG